MEAKGEMLQIKLTVVSYLKRGHHFDTYKTCCQILKNDMGMEEKAVDLSCPEEVLCKDADSLAKHYSRRSNNLSWWNNRQTTRSVGNDRRQDEREEAERRAREYKLGQTLLPSELRKER